MALGHGDGLLDRLETARHDAQAWMCRSEGEQRLTHPGRGVELVREEQVQRPGRAGRLAPPGLFQRPGQIEVVGTAAADGDTDARPVDLFDGLKRRVRGHEIGALDDD